MLGRSFSTPFEVTLRPARIDDARRKLLKLIGSPLLGQIRKAYAYGGLKRQNRPGFGASRGAGWGIAVSLGDAGATVYVTGRSLRGKPTTEGLPGTIDDTADEVTRRGGKGIAVRCDHTSDDDVTALFGAFAKNKVGSICWLTTSGAATNITISKPSWPRFGNSQSAIGMPCSWLEFVAHLIASQLAVPLMMPRKQGLIVNTIAWDAGNYLRSIYYDLAKTAVSRMALGMAQELKPHGIAAVALAPGFMRTERVMAAHAQHPFDLSRTESTEYLGRAVVALASDPNVMQHSGQTFTVGDLAQQYGFTDVDGKQPPPFRTS